MQLKEWSLLSRGKLLLAFLSSLLGGQLKDFKTVGF